MSANNLHKVAIIVPVFNAEKTLKRCLDSIVHQTLDDYEVIVINDGSFDHSLKIATKYAVKYHFLKVIDQSNKGLFVTRQEGIRLANSEYIGWVDADDFVDKTMFSTLYNQAVINDSELVYCDYYFYPRKIKTKEKWFREFKGKKDVNFVERNSQPWNKLVKTDLLKRMNIGNLFACCNDEAYIKVLLKAKNPISINKKLYYYSVGSDSMSTSYTNIEHYQEFVDASYNLRDKVGCEFDDKYWQEYFNYRIIYYLLVLMIVAGNTNNKTVYNHCKSKLNSIRYTENIHLKNILVYNFGYLKYVVISKVIPINFYLTRAICLLAFVQNRK